MRASPQVEISAQGVRIGEDDKTVRLSHTERNPLVRLVERGALGEV